MALPTVLDVLRTRREQGSTAGNRTDPYRVALAIEGGGNRAAYSAGMSIGLDELGLTSCFDAIYGTSGGALNAAWLLTGDAQKWLPTWGSPEIAALLVTDPRRVLRGGPVVDTSILVHHIYESVTPMNFAAILANPASLHPIATDAQTGRSVDLHPYLTDKASVQQALRASTCMPLLAGRPIVIDGRGFVDGGLSEAVPFRSALAQGATHVLALRTRRTNQQADAATVAERLALAPYFALFARGAGRAFEQRHLAYAEDDVRLASTETPHLLEVRPPIGAPNVSRLSRDLEVVRLALEIGRKELHVAWKSAG